MQGDRALFDASVWMVEAGMPGLTHNRARMPAVPAHERLPSYRALADNYDEWFPF